MSDQQTSSQVKLFQTRTSSSVSGQNASREITPGNSTDNTFSRELSKANERNVDQRSEQRTERTEKPNQSVSPSNKDSATQTEKNASQRPESSRRAGQHRAEQRREDESARPAETESVEHSKKSSDASKKISDTVEQKNAGSEAEQAAERLALNAERTKEQASQSSESVDAQLNVHPQDEKLVVPGSNGSVVSEIESTIGEASSTVHADEPVIEADAVDSASNETAVLPGVIDQTIKAVTTGIDPSSLKELKPGNDDVVKPTVQNLAVGEQLSSTQLANRQKHLFNNVANRPITNAVMSEQPTAVNPADLEAGNEASRSTTVAVSAAAQLAMAAKGKNVNSVSDRGRIVEDAPAKSSLLHVITGDSTAEQVAEKSRKADDIEVAANLTAKLAAKLTDQQTIQNNLLQARQIAQQQAQNLNPVTVATTSEQADRVNQSTDNMFLSSPGGIVTAPVVQRLEAGNSQTINAPINMPILQNDADKALAGNVRWMVNEGVKNAVVNVTPNGMGPISVSIGIEKDQMNISIVALQGSTREALDSMLPRLREQFAAQGQDNVRVDISDGRAEQSDRGYGQNFAGEQNGSEQGDSGRPNQTDVGEVDEQSVAGVELVDNNSQGLITINENGKITSRYDAYV